MASIFHVELIFHDRNVDRTIHARYSRVKIWFEEKSSWEIPGKHACLNFLLYLYPFFNSLVCISMHTLCWCHKVTHNKIFWCENIYISIVQQRQSKSKCKCIHFPLKNAPDDKKELKCSTLYEQHRLTQLHIAPSVFLFHFFCRAECLQEIIAQFVADLHKQMVKVRVLWPRNLQRNVFFSCAPCQIHNIGIGQ